MSSSDENELNEEQDILQQLEKMERTGGRRGNTDMLVSGWEDDDDLIEDDPKDTPEKMFLWAASEDKMDLVKSLLKTNPELVFAKDIDEYTALHKACYNNNYEMAEFLLMHKANPNELTEYKWTPLHSACKWNNARLAALMLQHGSNVNALSQGDQTPLHITATVSNCRETAVTLLMDPRINANLKNNSNDRALEIAQRTGLSAYLFKMGDSALDYVETGII